MKKLALDLGATKLSLAGERAGERYDDAALAGLASMTQLERVWLGRQLVTKLPALPPSLTRLSLSKCAQLASLAGIESLVRLQHLGLAELAVLDLAREMPRIAELPELTALELSGFAELPDALAKLPSLVHLEIDTADIDVALLAKLTTLRSLSITCREVPPAIAKLTRLERLAIKAPIRVLPSEICALTNLEVLDVERTKLQQLPLAIDKLAKLRELKLPFLSKIEQPASVRAHQAQQAVVFDGDVLYINVDQEMPREFDPKRLMIRLPERTQPIAQLSKLRRVEDVTLCLANLDDAVARLASAPRLRELTIEEAPSVPDLSALPIEVLTLEGGALTELPALPPLREIAIRKTALAKLPAKLAVQSLELRSQHAIDLAPLATWTGLRKVNLGGPFTLPALGSTIEALDLRGTATKTLAGIEKLTGLQRLDLRGLTIKSLAPLKKLGKLIWLGVPRVPDGVDVKAALPPGRWKKTQRGNDTFYERSA